MALAAPVHSLVLDTATGSGWELTLLCYGAPEGWGGLTVYTPADTPAGLTRAAAWLLARLA